MTTYFQYILHSLHNTKTQPLNFTREFHVATCPLSAFGITPHSLLEITSLGPWNSAFLVFHLTGSSLWPQLPNVDTLRLHPETDPFSSLVNPTPPISLSQSWGFKYYIHFEDLQMCVQPGLLLNSKLIYPTANSLLPLSSLIKGGSNNASSQSPSSLVNTCALSTIFTISLNGNPILPVAQVQDHGVIHISSPPLCPTSNPQKILPITLSKYVHDLTLSTRATLLPATSSLASTTVILS